MSFIFDQYNSGLALPDESKETTLLSDILSGTALLTANGRVYQLFGNEEEPQSLPIIPPIPSILAAPKSSALSLEDALEQIESFSTQTVNVKSISAKPNRSVAPAVKHAETTKDSPDSPTLQLFQALNESAAPQLAVKELPPKKGSATTQVLRLVSEPVEKPLIVPFVQPEPVAEEPQTETETITLKIVSEPILPIIFISPKIIQKYRYPQKKTLYRKRYSLPVQKNDDFQTANIGEGSVENGEESLAEQLTFQWSEQLDTLMQTADNQIRMLADHLLVQSNQGIKTVCFKSVFPGDGCSTILLCAVRALLDRQYRILLLDTHHQHIDLPKQLSLQEKVLTEHEITKLNESFGFWSWQESKTAEENRAVLANILAVHREEYDLILIDNGSVTESPLSELIGFWSQVALDGILLIANTKRPSEVPVSHIASRLRKHHIHVIGVTENYV